MAVYYNEYDPVAAQWLRELIKAGCIPKGHVDQRSILEVTSGDLRGFNQCHFFAGIGGWPYALKLAGWPEEKAVWTGSCPCQPFSDAGSRRGVCDKRHLWPAFQCLIKKSSPPIIFGEQVASKAGRYWFAGVRFELEALSYAVGGANLVATGVGAKHTRKRLFFLAYASSKGLQGSINKRKSLFSIKSEASTKCGHNGIRTWVFDSPTPTALGAFNGIPRPVGIVRGFGNAIVPQVAAEFIKASAEALGIDGFGEDN